MLTFENCLEIEVNFQVLSNILQKKVSITKKRPQFWDNFLK